MKNLEKKVKCCAIIFVTVIMTAMSFASCGVRPTGSNAVSQSDYVEYVNTGFVVTGPESYDSADTPVLVSKNAERGTITFLNSSVGKKYTLNVDGTTKIYDKYGEGISLNQLEEGSIVDVTFLKSTKHLTSIKLSNSAWNYDDVGNYDINTVKREVAIGEDIYKLSADAQYFSNGKSISEMELNAADILSFRGIDNTILSVVVEKGHGYLRLVNSENFIDGWIEIGQKNIQKITEDMLLTVPEGSYQVVISHKGNGGTKYVAINRDEETALDIGDLKVEEPKKGTILFSVTPSDAALYVDGQETDISQPVLLEYGIHQLIARADGYQSLTQYLRVGEESAGINIVLDSATVSENSAGTNNVVDTTTSYYKVYIDAPTNVEVYMDGNYKGVTPCSFRKEAGSHTITLRKTGFETRSYTVVIDSEEKDTTYSFADLESAISTKSLDSILFDTLFK